MTKMLSVRNLVVCSVLIVAFIGTGLHMNLIKLPITRVTSSLWSEDMATYEGTMKVADHVFVGKVIKQVGNRARFEIPETQFEVDVLRNMKGDLQGAVIVGQEGGYKDGVLYRSSDDITAYAADKPAKEKDDGLMKEGETYLFVTRYSEMGEWHDILPHSYGTKLLSRDKSLNGTTLKDLYEKDERFIKLKEAYEKGKKSEADVKKNGEGDNGQAIQGVAE